MSVSSQSMLKETTIKFRIPVIAVAMTHCYCHASIAALILYKSIISPLLLLIMENLDTLKMDQ